MIHTYVRRVPNDYLVKERDLHISRFLFGTLFVLLPTILLLLLLIHWQNQIYKLGYELTLLEHNLEKIEEKNMNLLHEREQWRDPRILDRQAALLDLHILTPDQLQTDREEK